MERGAVRKKKWEEGKELESLLAVEQSPTVTVKNSRLFPPVITGRASDTINMYTTFLGPDIKAGKIGFTWVTASLHGYTWSGREQEQ